MKKLYIIRHAQKEDEKIGLDDYDKSLTQQGKDDAEYVSKLLLKEGVNADLIVSSPALRTRQTAEIFAKNLNYDKTIMYNEVLYMAYVNELIETISYTFDTVDTMLLIAHNPSLTALAISLVGFNEKIEMGAVVEVQFDCKSWIDISKENAKLISYKKPQ